MGIGPPGRIEDLARLLMEELGVLGIDNEPAQLRRKRLDQADIVEEPVQEFRSRHPVVARLRGVGDEVAALEALLQRALMATGRSAGTGRDDEEQQGRSGPHRLPMVHQPLLLFFARECRGHSMHAHAARSMYALPPGSLGQGIIMARIAAGSASI
jgi:hypothetical protein